jgi:hypothetical protein
MALNSSGPISLAGTTTGQSIEVELGGNGVTMISLNDTAVRTLAGVASGAITMPTNFWGKSSTSYWITMFNAVDQPSCRITDDGKVCVSGSQGPGLWTPFNASINWGAGGTAAFCGSVPPNGSAIITSLTIRDGTNNTTRLVQVMKKDPSTGALLASNRYGASSTSGSTAISALKLRANSSVILVVSSPNTSNGNAFWINLSNLSILTGKLIGTGTIRPNAQACFINETVSYVGTYASADNVIIAKYNSTGSSLSWLIKYTFPAFAATSICSDVYESGSSTYFVGRYGASSSTQVGYLVKVNASTGAIQSSIQFPGSYSGGALINPNCIASDSNGNIYVSGFNYPNFPATQYGIFIIKFDSSLNVIWQRRIVCYEGATLSYIASASLQIVGDILYVSGPSTGAVNKLTLFKIPLDGSKTGTYIISSVTFIYESTTISSSSLSVSAASVSLYSPQPACSALTAGTNATNTPPTVTNVSI